LVRLLLRRERPEATVTNSDSLEFLLIRSIELAEERRAKRLTDKGGVRTRGMELYDPAARLPHETAHGRTQAKLDFLGELARGYAHGCVKLKDLGEAALEYAAALVEERA
jgi:hypothetical protein